MTSGPVNQAPDAAPTPAPGAPGSDGLAAARTGAAAWRLSSALDGCELHQTSVVVTMMSSFGSGSASVAERLVPKGTARTV